MSRQIVFFVLLLVQTGLMAKDRLSRTPFEISRGKASATYPEAIDFYKKLTADCKRLSMKPCGTADGGYPLYVVYYSGNGDFHIDSWKQQQKIIVLINNAIHAGEPDGVDATMMLMRDLASGTVSLPENVVLAAIPAFNIGGMMNRGQHSRANQNGPESYGFRGNAQNLDLNRDFMKCDARETKTLIQLFRLLDPDIFIDNHVSDGADYQHIMTLLPTQHDKLGGHTGDYLYNTLTPLIYRRMSSAGYDLVPYVNKFDNTPEQGWMAFNEPPRFVSGYAALFQCLAFVSETHMLKPYQQRVTATLEMMKQIATIAGEQAREIRKVRAQDRQALFAQTKFGLEWTVDSTQKDLVRFKGYEARYKKSEVSGLPRLYYDRNKPYTKQVPFYDHYSAKSEVIAPAAYIVPRGWDDVLERLRINEVAMIPGKKDTKLAVTAYTIDHFETVPKPYEKHYLHKSISVTPHTVMVTVKEGDFIIPTDQSAKRYLIEALEPTAPDGFFAWNFFDGILSQKEYFGDYVFEDDAAILLKKDPSLNAALQERKQRDTAFANNGAAQLDFIYRRSIYMEPGYMRYPVFRLETGTAH